jgi:hypothetical protein
MVSSEAIENQLFSKSGASAESAALQLAQGPAYAGAGARIEIYLRDGSLGRRFVVPALCAPFGLRAQRTSPAGARPPAADDEPA